jgi:hypothetical protein
MDLVDTTSLNNPPVTLWVRVFESATTHRQPRAVLWNVASPRCQSGSSLGRAWLVSPRGTERCGRSMNTKQQITLHSHGAPHRSLVSCAPMTSLFTAWDVINHLQYPLAVEPSTFNVHAVPLIGGTTDTNGCTKIWYLTRLNFCLHCHTF